MKKFVFGFALMAIAYCVCVSCTSEDEYYAGAEQYSYSAGELAEIQEMQSEYGVNFEFRKSGDKPLMSLEQMEKLCRVVAMMQSTANHGVRKDSAMFFQVYGKERRGLGLTVKRIRVNIRVMTAKICMVYLNTRLRGVM